MATLAETHNGQLRIQGNEVLIDAKDPDAAKFRVGSREVAGQSGGGGAVSFDVIERVEEGSPRIEAVVMVGGSNGRGGELGLCVWDGTRPISDASQRKVAEFRHDVVEFKVPITAPNLRSDATRFYHQGGRFVTNYQDDGHIVTLDMGGTADESQWVPVWSSWHGLLRPLPW